MLDIRFANRADHPAHTAQTDAVIILAGKDGELSASANRLNEVTDGLIAKAAEGPKFTGKAGKTMALTAPADLSFNTVIIAGMADPDHGPDKYEQIGAAIAGAAKSAGVEDVTLYLDDDNLEAAMAMGLGATLKSYHFDKYKTKKDNSDSDDQDETNFEQLIIAMDGADQAADEWPKTRAVAEGVYFARDLVTEPPNRLTPASYADRVVEKFGPTDATVTVLDEDELNDLGFNAHLAVGMGSDNPSRLVIIEHHGGNSGDAPLAFVGKGITFDTGGISLKPSKGMWDMKYDMGGSASVVGAMLSLVKRSAPVNAIGVIGLAENMPSARAQRPSDVVKSYSGQTIEVLNTDAEGRLVLSDCLYYTQEKYNPAIMIDFATLTGSAVVALGHEHAALYSENDGLIKGLRTAGSKTWDRVWQMPLDKNYDQLMDSDIADIKNINTKGKAGSITAAQFLKRFTNDHKGWAHLDIAGVAWTDSAKNSHPKGATGFGVRLLDQYVRDHHG